MKIIWTEKSTQRFQEIDEYVLARFGKGVSQQFRSKVFNFLELLSRFPKLGSLEVPNKNIYGFQISKQTRIFYRINKNHIILLTFFDNRQDPD